MKYHFTSRLQNYLDGTVSDNYQPRSDGNMNIVYGLTYSIYIFWCVCMLH